MNDHQKGREGWQSNETVPIAVKESEVETYLRHKSPNGLILLFTLCRAYIWSSILLDIFYLYHLYNFFSVKRNQKSLQSLYSQVLPNFIN